MPRLFLTASILFAAGFAAVAQSPSSDLKPRPVNLAAKAMPLSEVLKTIEEQTGNKIIDARLNKTNPEIQIQARTFWTALDAIGLLHGIGFSAFQEGESIALVDTPYRARKIHHSGLFRFAHKHIAVSKDEETLAHLCHVTFHVAWEPRLKCVYVNFDGGDAAYAAPKRGASREKLDKRSAQLVIGACATELELKMRAPDRLVRSIESLNGEIRVIGAPKMLDFDFAKAGDKKETEGVIVRLAKIETAKKAILVDLESEHPKGAILELESHNQHRWKELERVWIRFGSHRVDGRELSEDSIKGGRAMRYEFAMPKGVAVPTRDSVTVHYSTPSRIVAFTVPFSFQDLPLP